MKDLFFYQRAFLSAVAFFLSIHTIVAQEKSLGEARPVSISDGWVVTDALGRELPGFEETGIKREDRYIGMFYWTWHCEERGIDVEPVNVNDIISSYPEARNEFNHPAWTHSGRHHWGEPLYGFYTETDPWVLREHAEMLADAGVDVVFFDNTNQTFLWEDAVHALGKTWSQAYREGIRTPQFVFMCPFGPRENSRIMIENIYNSVYKKGLYKDLWFYWEGKPLIMGYPENLSRELQDFFTFRPPQPAYDGGPKRPDQWGWLEFYPQNGYVEYAPGRFEQVTVGVAMNATDSLTPAAMNDTLQVYGRSYTQRNGMDMRPEAVNYGLNFQEQWERAFELDPKLVFVTGWNEWVAGRAKTWQGTSNALPDLFDQEYSRDIEPMKGGHGDNYYYQLVDNVRRFKGMAPSIPPSSPRTIIIDGEFGDWAGVKPEFRDHRDLKAPRDHRGWGSTWYRNNSGRNDILVTKVSRDEKYLYFFVETAEDISPPADRWMMLLVDLDRDKRTGWQGYDFVVNRKTPRGELAIVEKCAGRWKWNETGTAEFKLNGRQMELRIPRDLLSGGRVIGSIEFKWSDNMQEEGDIMDFYLNGDVAPSGRFNYLYPAF